MPAILGALQRGNGLPGAEVRESIVSETVTEAIPEIVPETVPGIDAETVIPANSPRYVFADDSIIDNNIPRNIALRVNSLFLYIIKFYKHT